MDDIPSASAERDIQLYLSNKLTSVSADLKDTDINMLAQKYSGGPDTPSPCRGLCDIWKRGTPFG
jgi:hypothetical protein